MDLQNKLKQALIFFTKKNLKYPHVYIHSPGEHNLYQYCVVLSGEYKGFKIKGSSSGTNLYIVFLKALSELGENIICCSLNLENRSGIAGGLFRRNAIIRAKAEMIERDSFLFHYRRIHPFEKKEENEKFVSYILNSIDPVFHVYLIMTPKYINSPDTCLIFGMGCDISPNAAYKKAYNEFSTMLLSHNLFSCKDGDLKDPGQWIRKADFHHANSLSKENKIIFSKICNQKGVKELRQYNPKLWTIEDIISPIKFFSFVKVGHPQLEQLKFGEAESFTQFSNVVYHPFW